MNTPFERLEIDDRAEWLELPTTRAFLGTMQGVRDQVALGLVESIKAGTIDERTMFVAGGELRALDQLLAIISRPRCLRG